MDVNTLYEWMVRDHTCEEDIDVLPSLVEQLRQQQQQQQTSQANSLAIKELPLANMESNGVHDPDLILMRDLFTGKDKNITWEAIRQGEVAVSKDVYLLGNGLNPQPIYLCTGIFPANVETILTVLCSSQTKRIMENNFYSANQIDLIRPNTIHTYCMSITHENFPLVWPFENVDYVIANTIIYESQTNFYYYIRKSMRMDNVYKVPSPDVCMRALLFEGWIFYYDPQTKSTKYFTIHVCNATQRGWGGMSNIWNRILENRAQLLHSNVLSCLNLPIDPNDNNGVLETLKINNERQQEKALLHFNSIFIRKNQDSSRLKRIIYTSRFKHHVPLSELDNIEETSIRNNSKAKITGILMCSDKLIYQVLEGKTSEVDATYERILMDSRHYDIQCVAEEFDLDEEDRQYPNWSMKVVNLSEYQSYFANMIQQFLKNSYNVFDVDNACLF